MSVPKESATLPGNVLLGSLGSPGHNYRFFGSANFTETCSGLDFFARGTTAPKLHTKQRFSCANITLLLIVWCIGTPYSKQFCSLPLSRTLVRRASVVAISKVTHIAPSHRRMPSLSWKDSFLLMDLLFGLGKCRFFSMCKMR